jgi:antitoxin HigA-1
MIQSFRDDDTKDLFAITPDTALRLARFFGNSAEFWLNLQQMRDLSKARLALKKTIKRDMEAYAGS